MHWAKWGSHPAKRSSKARPVQLDPFRAPHLRCKATDTDAVSLETLTLNSVIVALIASDTKSPNRYTYSANALDLMVFVCSWWARSITTTLTYICRQAQQFLSTYIYWSTNNMRWLLPISKQWVVRISLSENPYPEIDGSSLSRTRARHQNIDTDGNIGAIVRGQATVQLHVVQL